ncbi:DUF421 domain-containing protein [Hyphomonas chukchiensis]|uniref:DUF421 domain-containing protein n=1 Tax=Hyphomonas chukchiensis TaxID=1280947 RepID=UPI0030F6210F
MFTPDNPIVDLIVRGLVLGPVALIWIVTVARFIGLRTFSKMTVFDFVSTIATGSLLAGAASAVDWQTFIQNTIGVMTILGAQTLMARLRMKSRRAAHIMENEPLILVRDGVWCPQTMERARVSKEDIWAKMRAANCLQLAEVQAAVLETTGDVLILHGARMDKEVLQGVANAKKSDV